MKIEFNVTTGLSEQFPDYNVVLPTLTIVQPISWEVI
jgi:hypothetical protein